MFAIPEYEHQGGKDLSVAVDVLQVWWTWRRVGTYVFVLELKT